MKIDILTLFPEMFDTLKTSIVGKAIENNLIKINAINIRDFSEDKHKRVDDTPYGGGAGMVIKPDVVYNSYNSIEKGNETKTIYLSPQGKVLTHERVKELSKEEHIILICGHYEGIDERVLEEISPEEISIGDYVLTGGEIPAMVLIDSISRYIDGVINKESTLEESFENNLLEYPQYTRPEIFLDKKVPEVLLSGNHKEIEEWRKKQAIETTKKKRPDIFNKKEEKKWTL